MGCLRVREGGMDGEFGVCGWCAIVFVRISVGGARRRGDHIMIFFLVYIYRSQLKCLLLS